MALFAKTLQILRTKATPSLICRYLSTNSTKCPAVPTSFFLNFNPNQNNHWIYKQPDLIKTPISHVNRIELPNGLFYEPKIERDTGVTIEAPASDIAVIEKQAARLIVIRRKKMKKHKLRKLRKRMKFEWAKIRQKRELQKEKEFQAGLIKQCKEAEAFSAEKYVADRLNKLHEIIIPKYWKGRRLPEFLIREKMGLPPKN